VVGRCSVAGVVAGLILAATLALSAMLLLGLALAGLVVGFCLASGIAETIALVGSAFGLDEEGSSYPRLRRFVERCDRLGVDDA
jgi:hypothetical protein